MAEVVGVGPTEIIERVEVVEKGRQIPQKVSLNGTVIGPVKGTSHAVKEAVTVCWHADNAEPVSCEVISDVVQITGVRGRSRIICLADAVIALAPIRCLFAVERSELTGR